MIWCVFSRQLSREYKNSRTCYTRQRMSLMNFTKTNECINLCTWINCIVNLPDGYLQCFYLSQVCLGQSVTWASFIPTPHWLSRDRANIYLFLIPSSPLWSSIPVPELAFHSFKMDWMQFLFWLHHLGRVSGAFRFSCSFLWNILSPSAAWMIYMKIYILSV